MITTVKKPQVTKLTWNESHVGMIHYNSYSLKYSLVLAVKCIELESTINKVIHFIRELEYFNTSCSPVTVKEHTIPLASDDEFYTIEEFNSIIESNQVNTANEFGDVV